MESLIPWLTPALIVALFGWVRADIRGLRREMTDLRKEMTGLRQEMNVRFDQVTRELADLRERMAKLEGSLEGFLAGRRDRDVA